MDIKLLLDTGAQGSFISSTAYEAKIGGRARKQKCFVCLYGARGQKLATTGEVEQDVQIETDIVWQKFIIADIQEEGMNLGLILV